MVGCKTSESEVRSTSQNSGDPHLVFCLFFSCLLSYDGCLTDYVTTLYVWLMSYAVVDVLWTVHGVFFHLKRPGHSTSSAFTKKGIQHILCLQRMLLQESLNFLPNRVLEPARRYKCSKWTTSDCTDAGAKVDQLQHVLCGHT